MAEDRNENTSKQDTGDLLSALLSDPEKITKIKGIIDNFSKTENRVDSPQGESTKLTNNVPNDLGAETQEDFWDSPPPQETSANLDLSSKLPDILSLFGGHSSQNSAENKEQIALLLAIRPYLSENRKQLIDTFIKFNRISHILRKL